MDNIVLTVYYNLEWEINGDVCQFNGVKESKAVVVKEVTNYDELVGIIAARFLIDTSVYDVRLTHANTIHPSLNPCDINSTEDIQSFFAISKMANISWRIPICVSLNPKLNDSVHESFRGGSRCFDMDVDSGDNPMDEHSGDVLANEKNNQADTFACEHEVVTHEVYDHSLASIGRIKKGQSFKSKEETLFRNALILR